jgi:hypothetical protein
MEGEQPCVHKAMKIGSKKYAVARPVVAAVGISVEVCCFQAWLDVASSDSATSVIGSKESTPEGWLPISTKALDEAIRWRIDVSQVRRGCIIIHRYVVVEETPHAL